MNDLSVSITPAYQPEFIATIRQLFREYADSLNIDLCFQNFNQELENLPGDYAPPDGMLLQARCHDQLAGCVAMRQLEAGICEMKRLYVKPAFRGRSIGRHLADRIISQAKQSDYRAMRLDTLTSLTEAISLYRSLGFVEIAPYNFHPIPNTLFMERIL